MLNEFKKSIHDIATKNIKQCILIISVFFAGVALSCFLGVYGSAEEIRLYINDFVFNVKNYSIDPGKTFVLSMMTNIKCIALIMFMSWMLIGYIGIVAFVFLKGFSYGIFFCSLIDILGWKAIVVFFCLLFPHALLSVPCFISYLILCFNNSLVISKEIKNKKSHLLLPCIFAIITSLLLCLSAGVQAYVEPILIRMI